MDSSPHILIADAKGRHWGLRLDSAEAAESIPDLFLDWPLERIQTLAQGLRRFISLDAATLADLAASKAVRAAEPPRDASDEVWAAVERRRKAALAAA